MLEYLEYIIVQYFGNSLGNVLWRAEMRFKITAATTGSMRLPVARPQNIQLPDALSSHVYSTSHYLLCLRFDSQCENTMYVCGHTDGLHKCLSGHTDRLEMDMQCTHCQAGFTNTHRHTWLFLQSNSRSYDWDQLARRVTSLLTSRRLAAQIFPWQLN